MDKLAWLYNPDSKPSEELSKHDQEMIQLGWDAHRTLEPQPDHTPECIKHKATFGSVGCTCKPDQSRLLTDEELVDFLTISDGETTSFLEILKRVRDLTASLVRADMQGEIGEWLDKNIMSTDNRVTKLWVLGDLAKALKSGTFKGEE